MDTTIGQLLSGIFSGGYGLSQLGSAGSTAASAAATANPFGSQYSSYQPQLQSAITQLLGQQGSSSGQLSTIINQMLASGGASTQVNGIASLLGGLTGNVSNFNTNAGSVPTSVSGAGGNLQSQVNSLSSNYMSNPAIQAQYQLGLGTTEAGLAAQGLSSSGAADVALTQYGQNFASNAYQQQLTDLLNTSQTTFNENTGATQLGAALQGQTFNQGITQMSTLSSMLTGEAGLLSSGQSLELNPLTAAGSLAGTQGNLNLSSTQNLISQLLSASGAAPGSPSTAGAILSGQFGNQNTAASNIGAGLGGIGGAISSLLGGSNSSGLGSLLSSLLGSSGSADTIGGVLGSVGDLGSASSLGLDLGDLATTGVDSDLGVGLGALGGLF